MTTIGNCWRKSGILPDTLLNPTTPNPTPIVTVSSLLNEDPASSDPITVAEKQVDDSLAHLERIGVLHQRNRMDLDELLNPANEHNIYNHGTEEEIYQAVIERREAQQNKETMGGDDVDDGSPGDSASEEKPSRRDALLAASTLRRYVADLDDSFARKLEVIVASFGRQPRLDEFQSLKPTTITNHFASE